jgi:lipopolysaccharide/colanic/teichoic acid biosynthesis glycosyltransferase
MKIHPYYSSQQKRVFDLVLSLMLVVLLSPLLLLISLVIWFTAGWPVIFRQKRAGEGGRNFMVCKFRTMEKNAPMLKHHYLKLNEAPEPMFKIYDDPRFVGIGKFLSQSGLDELPQLWNILRGEMSFIGPRPLPSKEAQALPQKWQKLRNGVKPGVFSEWSTALQHRLKLTEWQELEKNTLKQGGLKYEVQLIMKTFQKLFKTHL